MDEKCTSGLIPMFLSGLGQRSAVNGEPRPARNEPGPLRRILVISSGRGPCLASSVKSLAFGLGRRHAAVNLYAVQDRPKAVSAFDGVVIGIEPDGTGSTQRAFSFMRAHLSTLSTLPVALFFLLSRAPDHRDIPGLFDGLSRVHPLDVEIFESPAPHLARKVTAWAEERIWPLMETAWLADLIFPAPAVPKVCEICDQALTMA